MRMLVADRARGMELAMQVAFDGQARIAGRIHHHFDVAHVKDIDGTAAHAARNDHICAHVAQEIGQKARFVAGVWNVGFRSNGILYDIIEPEIFGRV